MNWIDAAERAMLSQPHFWLWSDRSTPEYASPVIVYGHSVQHPLLPEPVWYSYVVLPEKDVKRFKKKRKRAKRAKK